MAQLDLNMIIVIAYLVITLFVGIYTGRNIKSIKEYAVGNQNFSNTALVATITATWIGAGFTIGIHEKVYEQGIMWIIIFLCGVIEIFIFKLLSPRIRKFRGSFTSAEILEKWYGKKVRRISSLCVALYSMGLIGAQIGALGYVFNEFFNLPAYIGILIGGGIVVLYSSLGGIKSVAYTDLIQFFFFIVAIPLIASIMLAEIKGFKGLLNVPVEHLKFFPNYQTKLEYLTLLVWFMIPSCDPCLVQRVLMAKDSNQIVHSFKITALIIVLFYLICGIISLSTLVLNPNLDSSNVLYHVINNYLPSGIKGVGIAGLISIVMSTADSYLNVASVTIIHDLLKPSFKNNLDPKKELIATKIVTFVIGCGAIIVASNFKSIVDIMLKTWVIWGPVIIVPFYAAVIGIRSNFYSFILAAIAGVIAVIYWEVYNIDKLLNIDSAIPGFFVNLLVFTLSTLYYNRFSPDKLFKPDLVEEEEEEEIGAELLEAKKY